MKAHKAKMQGNEGPEGEKLQNGAGHGADKSIVRTLGKRAIFGNMWGGVPKLAPKRPKCKEMTAHKATLRPSHHKADHSASRPKVWGFSF